MKQVLIFFTIAYSFSLSLYAQNDSIFVSKREYNELRQNEKEYNKQIAVVNTCNEKQEKLNKKLRTKKKELTKLEFEIQNLNYELGQAKSSDLIKKDIAEAQNKIIILNHEIADLKILKYQKYRAKLKLLEDSIKKAQIAYNKNANKFLIVSDSIKNLKKIEVKKNKQLEIYNKRKAHIEDTSKYYIMQNRILRDKALNNDSILEALKNPTKQKAMHNSFIHLCENCSTFLSASDYDLDKNTFFLNQAKKYKNNFLFLMYENGQHDYQRIVSLYKNLKNNQQIIWAINASHKNLTKAYNKKEALMTLSKLEKALDLNNHVHDLNKYKTLISNYGTKNNEAYKILKTAKSFNSIGQAKDAKQLLKNSKVKFEDYPFLVHEFNRVLRNFNYQLKIKNIR